MNSHQKPDTNMQCAEILKAAYEAAVNLFGREETPPFRGSGYLDGFDILLKFYNHQYTLEKDAHQATERYAQDLRSERAALRNDNQALRSEVEVLKSQLLKSSQRTEYGAGSDVEELRARFSGLNTTQPQSLKTHEGMNDQLKSEISTLKSQLFRSNERSKDLERKVIERGSTVTALESSITHLQSLQPLVEVGSSTRIRCLEKSRLKVEACPRNKLDYVIIEKGNSAAHHGDGDADAAAIVHSGLLPQLSQTKYSKIFAKMYQSDVSSWRSLPRKLKDALNCVATLNGLEAFVVYRTRQHAGLSSTTWT